jgi:hypothetical protein
LQIRGTWSAGPGDDKARFLADLRALRDSAAIGYDEMAARAHYPSDILKEAENGPGLPGLPILAAYVRACEGDVLDWEERWRRLNPEVPDDPDLPVRPAGASPAAVAGARAGVGVGPPDVYDPERIRAALRGDHGRSAQDSRRTNEQGVSALAHGAARSGSSDRDLLMDSGASRDGGASWGTSSSWDTPADPGITSANGNHSAGHSGRGPFDAAFTVVSDPADHTEPAQDEDFSWLDDSKQERAAEPADRDFAWLDRAEGALAAEPEAQPAPEPAVTELIPQHQAGGLMSPERTDFWAKPVTSASASASASADLQQPAPAPRAQEPAIARASWPGPADTTTTSTAESAQRTATDTAPGVATAATTAQALSSAGSAAQAAVSEQDGRRQDRFFPVRLLAVIVIAALIGSALVLLLK